VVFKEVGSLLKYDDIISTGLKMAGLYPYQRLLGFDLCVDREGNVRLIEVNNRNNEINFFQMAGEPLFREYTGEVVNWCAGRPKSFLIDFDI